MRGTLKALILQYSQKRNTPAYAGNTACHRSGGMKAAEHPRVCGEHLVLLSGMLCYSGTPPRMRGTLLMRVLDLDQPRNTPAYAGNTSFASSIQRLAQEHPRVCGEHCMSIEYRVYRLGTPPRMRGTPCSFLHHLQYLRNTPAYAGNTLAC